MKKLSLFLIALLLLSITGCGGKEKTNTASTTPDSTTTSEASSNVTKETTSKEDSTVSGAAEENTTKESASTDNLLSKSYADMMKNGKFFIRFKNTVTTEAGTVEGEITTATDGGVAATLIKAQGFTSHMIMKDNVLYMLDDTNKTYTKMELDANTQAAASGDIIDAAGLTYVGSGTDTINDKTLPYEEYSVSNGTLRYYFEGTKLYAIVSTYDTNKVEMIVLEMSDNIPADLLTIPADYKESTDATATPGGVGMTDEDQKELEQQLKDLGIDPETGAATE